MGYRKYKRSKLTVFSAYEMLQPFVNVSYRVFENQILKWIF